MENESSIKDIINNAMKDVRTILDTDTVVGNPINLPNGISIIPISRISMGFASGGLDVPTRNENRKSFGGGGGTGVTVTPVGFLTVYPEGRVEMVPITGVENSPVEQISDLLNRAPEIIGQIRSAFTGEDEEGEEEVPELVFDDGTNPAAAE